MIVDLRNMNIPFVFHFAPPTAVQMLHGTATKVHRIRPLSLGYGSVDMNKDEWLILAYDMDEPEAPPTYWPLSRMLPMKP